MGLWNSVAGELYRDGLRPGSCGPGIMSCMCMGPWAGRGGCDATPMVVPSTYECGKSDGIIEVGYCGPRRGMSPMKGVPWRFVAGLWTLLEVDMMLLVPPVLGGDTRSECPTLSVAPSSLTWYISSSDW